ncbi:hypothetical protein [uncultured Cyclobacterium sp.]|uniref:RipA family octameric membrane protein n=1 Tax=uncultured Cyclobacterium sp. TaxID=453820 RepID=UPI0030EF1DDF
MSEQENNNFERNIFERYKLLISARDFHYENFNKWLTYFYVANAAIFVGYIQLLISKETGNNGFDIDLASKGRDCNLNSV